MNLVKIFSFIVCALWCTIAVHAETPLAPDSQSDTVNGRPVITKDASVETGASAASSAASAATSEVQVGGVQGGEASFGCLGCQITVFGTIVKVFPESDLNRFNITANDKVTDINGHKFQLYSFQKECLGLPGTIIVLDVVHRGEPEKISVERVDSRLLSARAARYKRISEKRITW